MFVQERGNFFFVVDDEQTVGTQVLDFGSLLIAQYRSLMRIVAILTITRRRRRGATGGVCDNG